MNKQTRRKFTPEFKARVTLEALRGQLTLAELAQKFEINSVMISRWKTECIENMAMVFEGRSVPTEEAVDVDKLFAQIGQLKVENDFLKKSCKKLGI